MTHAVCCFDNVFGREGARSPTRDYTLSAPGRMGRGGGAGKLTFEGLGRLPVPLTCN